MVEKPRESPSPDELRLQMLGACCLINFILEMHRCFPDYWRDHEKDILHTLYGPFYQNANQKVHTDTLWKILLTQKPDPADTAALKA